MLVETFNSDPWKQGEITMYRRRGAVYLRKSDRIKVGGHERNGNNNCLAIGFKGPG